MKEKKYIASCSFGKDSIATILLALENGEPLDGVVFSEVMFDLERGISGEIPEHIEWVYGVAIPRLRDMGVSVDVVRAKKDYVSLCKTILKKGKNAGKMYGIQNSFPCYANGYLKVAPIRDYYKCLSKDYDIVQYVGIALDESKRLSRLEGTNKVSLLAKYGYTEAMAMDKCREYGLVSPCYSMSNRGGCWFCYNGGIERYCHIRKNYPELWDGLKDLYISTASPYLRFNKTWDDVEREMDAREWEDSQPKLF
jgi:hypothetical protein